MQFSLLQNITPAEMEEIGQLRTLVWTGESDVNLRSLGPKPWIDDIDDDACIWMVRDDRSDDGPLVASARVTVHTDPATIPYHAAFDHRLPTPGPYASMNRLVVHPDYRGRGIARMLDCLRLRHAPRVGAAMAVVIASGRRVSALELLGFENLGAPCETPELLRTEQKYSILVHRLQNPPNLPVIDWARGGASGGR